MNTLLTPKDISLKADVKRSSSLQALRQYDQYLLEKKPQVSYSQEFFSTSVKSIIPNVVKSFKDYVKSFSLLDLFSKKGIEKQLLHHSDVDYLTYEYVESHIPPYFSGTYVEYTALLREMATVCQKLPANLAEYKRNIAEMMGDPRACLKDRKEAIALLSQEKTQRESLKSDLARLHSAKNQQTIVQYIQVVKRQLDLKQMASHLNATETLLVMIDPKQLKQDINEISALLDKLKEDQVFQGKEGTAPIKMDKTLLEYLTKGTLEIAEQVEFYSLLRYQYDLFIGCVERTLKNMDKVA